jgi:hypothetical protein
VLLALLIVAVVAVVAGCSGEQVRAEEAGAQSASWTLEDRPLFSVTENAGVGGSRPFQIVSFGHALVLADGRTVVADQNGLLYFDTAGRAVTVAGGRGNGPGEFTRIRAVFEAADAIGAFDEQSRISLYSRTGEHIRDIRFEMGPYPAVHGWLRSSGPVTSSARPREQRRYTIRNASGAPVRTFVSPVTLPSFNVYWPPGTGGPVLRPGPGGAPGIDRGQSSPALECTPRDLAVVVGDVLYVADQAAGRILALSTDGTQREIYRSLRRPRVTAAILADLRRSYLRDGTPPDSIAAVLARFGREGSPLPFTWESILADPSGRLWLQVAKCIGPGEREWEVIDTTGRALATFRSGAGGVRAVRGNRAAVITADSVDVIYVNLFRIRSQAGRGADRDR